MKLIKRLLVSASILAAPLLHAEDGCICFHVDLDKDGNPSEVKSHDTSCTSHTYVTPLSSAGPTFEPTVFQVIARNSNGGRIIATPSWRLFVWEDKDGNSQHCVVPDIHTRGELQPARSATAPTTTITYSLEKLPAQFRDQARLAANAWNIKLAGIGKKTRLIEDTGNTNVVLGYNDIGKLFGPTHIGAEGITFTPDTRLTSHPEWLVPFSQITLNSAAAADYSDPMVPVQVFGHEFGHVLNLDHSFGHQLMAAGMQYMDGDEVVKMMAPGTYAPNLCEVAKAADNGLP